MTNKQISQLEILLKGLAESKCLHKECDDGKMLGYEHRSCKGSGLDPRTEMFRVKCEEGGHFTMTRQHGETESRHYHLSEMVYPGCNGIRLLTIAEATAKGLDMLEWLSKEGHEEIFWDSWDVQDMPILLAILSAIASSVGLEVTETHHVCSDVRWLPSDCLCVDINTICDNCWDCKGTALRFPNLSKKGNPGRIPVNGLDDWIHAISLMGDWKTQTMYYDGLNYRVELNYLDVWYYGNSDPNGESDIKEAITEVICKAIGNHVEEGKNG